MTDLTQIPRLPLRVWPVALDLAWQDPAENVRRMEAVISQSLNSRRDLDPHEQLFVFPELTLTGFVTDEAGPLALPASHEAVGQVLGLARRYRTGVVFGYPKQNPKGGKPLNVLVLATPAGELKGEYEKIHLFTSGKNPEAEAYAAGREGKLLTYRGWKLGLSICFDLRFPTLFKAYAEAGADVMLLPACWLGGPTKSRQFKTLAAAQAVLSQSFFVAVNRSGKDPHFSYEGEACVYGPRGEVLLESGGTATAGAPAPSSANLPVELKPELLASARALVVRPSARATYEVFCE